MLQEGRPLPSDAVEGMKVCFCELWMRHLDGLLVGVAGTPKPFRLRFLAVSKLIFTFWDLSFLYTRNSAFDADSGGCLGWKMYPFSPKLVLCFAQKEELEERRSSLVTQVHMNAQMKLSVTTPGQVEQPDGEGYTLAIPLIENK